MSQSIVSGRRNSDQGKWRRQVCAIDLQFVGRHQTGASVTLIVKSHKQNPMFTEAGKQLLFAKWEGNTSVTAGTSLSLSVSLYTSHPLTPITPPINSTYATNQAAQDL